MTLKELKEQRPTPQRYSNLYDEWIDSAIAYAEQTLRVFILEVLNDE